MFMFKKSEYEQQSYSSWRYDCCWYSEFLIIKIGKPTTHVINIRVVVCIWFYYGDATHHIIDPLHKRVGGHTEHHVLVHGRRGRGGRQVDVTVGGGVTLERCHLYGFGVVYVIVSL